MTESTGPDATAAALDPSLPSASEKYAAHIERAAREFVEKISPLIQDDTKAQASIRKLRAVTNLMGSSEQTKFLRNHPEYRSVNKTALTVDLLTKDEGSEPDLDFDPLAPYIAKEPQLKKLQDDIQKDWGVYLQARTHEGEKVLVHHGAIEHPYTRAAIRKMFTLDSQVTLDELVSDAPEKEKGILYDLGPTLIKIRNDLAQTEKGALQQQLTDQQVLWKKLGERIASYITLGELPDADVNLYGLTGKRIRRAVMDASKKSQGLRDELAEKRTKLRDVSRERHDFRRENERLERKNAYAELCVTLSQYALQKAMTQITALSTQAAKVPELEAYKAEYAVKQTDYDAQVAAKELYKSLAEQANKKKEELTDRVNKALNP